MESLWKFELETRDRQNEAATERKYLIEAILRRLDDHDRELKGQGKR